MTWVGAECRRKISFGVVSLQSMSSRSKSVWFKNEFAIVSKCVEWISMMFTFGDFFLDLGCECDARSDKPNVFVIWLCWNWVSLSLCCVWNVSASNYIRTFQYLCSAPRCAGRHRGFPCRLTWSEKWKSRMPVHNNKSMLKLFGPVFLTRNTDFNLNVCRFSWNTAKVWRDRNSTYIFHQ